MEFNHKSVLLDEVIAGLAIKPDGIYVDGTLGGAGHGSVVCSKLGKNGRFIGLDQDEDAIAASTKRLEPYQDKVTIVRSNYSDMVNVLHDLGVEKADGITLDLGVSSFQLDTGERGFSYRFDAPLDMRMDNRQELTAYQVVNEYTESELYHIIKNYGEDKFAKNIAKNIVIARQKEPVKTTKELADIISYSIPMKVKKQGGHPAKRTFQAIRIEVNHELEVLERNINDMIDLLNPGGRFCIITFHSLEDRIVKKAFRTAQNRVHAHRIFRFVYVVRNQRGKWYIGNRYCHRMRNWKKILVQRAQSSGFLNIFKERSSLYGYGLGKLQPNA